MLTVRRWYVYLVSAISLQAVAWAIVGLLRALLHPNQALIAIGVALPIAIIIVGGPIFLGHWLWAEYLARREPSERESTVRQFYLFGMLAAFVFPIVANIYSVSAAVLRSLLSETPPPFGEPPPALNDTLVDSLVLLVVLGALWLYHKLLIAADARSASAPGSAPTLRRFYILGFSFVGLATLVFGCIQLLRWMLYRLDGYAVAPNVTLSNELARLIVGVPVWLIFWLGAQRLFHSESAEERESALRKLYLYLVVMIAVFGAISTLALILAGIFRLLLGLAVNGDVRDPLSFALGTIVVWVYHSYVLGSDARQGMAPRQAGLRRLYRYLIAGVALAAFLIGLSGDLSVLVRGSQSFVQDLKEQAATFSAALVSGFLVWIVPWAKAQRDAMRPGTAGAEDRRSTVRKIYLYFYLFVATITVLGNAVYIVFRLLSLVLGQPNSGNLLTDLGQAIAFTVVAGSVWLYHGYILRGDGARAQREKVERLAGMQIAVLDGEQGSFGRALIAELQREWPGLNILPVALTSAAAETTTNSLAGETLAAQLAHTGLIVGPWQMALAGGGGIASAGLASAVIASTARKLMVPTQADGWNWVGFEGGSESSMVQQTARAVKQIIEGEPARAGRAPAVNFIIGLFVFLIIACVVLLVVPLLLFSLR